VNPEPPSEPPADPSSSTSSPAHIVVCAGETSGDHLGAGLVHAIRERRPQITFSGMGGEAMRSAGVDTLVDVSELAVVGLWEVLVQYPRLRGLLHRMQRHLETARPQLLVLVDYVEFNLRLAAHARQLGIRVLFYVSPQVWAWRQGRIHRIKRSVDAMAVLFPFEEALYREHGIPVRYVGNPLVDRVRKPERDLRAQLELGPDTPLIGLLPGSRKGELQRHWPLLVDTARCLLDARPAMRFAVPLAPGITPDMLTATASWEGLPVTLVQGSEAAHEVMAASDLLLISSGTATLEAALLEAPMIVIYRMAAVSHAVFSRLIRVPHIALVNIVAGAEVVPERLQKAANPTALCREALDWLDHPEKLEALRVRLREIRELLGEGGADRRVAAAALEVLDTGTLADPQ